MNTHKPIPTRTPPNRIAYLPTVRPGLNLIGLGIVTAIVAILAGMAGAASYARAATCANETFRTGPSSVLPDCRAYEMVSPPDKNGGEVDGGVYKGAMAPPEQAASDGEAVTYGSTSAFVDADPESALVASQYLSMRTAGGWLTRGIVPTQQLPKGRVQLSEGSPPFSPFQGFNEDLSAGFLLAWNPQPDPSAPSGYFNPYLFETGTGSYQLLSDVTPESWSPGEADLAGEGFNAVYAGMSADGQHVIFEANDALTPEAIPGRTNLYEWSVGRPLELVSVLPEGAVDASGDMHPLDGDPLTFGAAGGEPYEMASVDGALSRDGVRAFWSGGGSTNGQLYMHEVVGSGARTVEVSASQNPAVASGSAPATYRAASSDGSHVYFTSSAKLTADSTASGGGSDLYEYDADTGVLSDLSVDQTVGETAGVQGVFGTGESNGVSYVYFAATGVLASGATAGAENVYVSRGGSSSPVFVASLGGFEGEALDFAGIVKLRTSRVSPDGRLLVFQSALPLTGYDNRPANGRPCPERPREDVAYYPFYEEAPEGRCMEVFEYDAQSAKLTCVSCNPEGLPPTGDSLVPETQHLYGRVLGWESSSVQQRYLLDDGRVFFQSEDTLLSQATNGRQNIYEYEPESVGQCATSGRGGCVYLISTGQSSANSYFADASADGRDVFFLTNEQLVSQDGDGAVDMYDAREGGGFSSAVPPPCTGEACKPAVRSAPAIYGAPASATFQGVGNTTEPTGTTKAVKKIVKKKEKKKRKLRHGRNARAGSRGHGGRASRSGRRSERGRR